jgi:hypothetical protein
MSPYGPTLDLLFLVGVAGILFLCWVLLHLHMDSRQSRKGRPSRGPTHLRAERRIQSDWKASGQVRPIR